VKEKPMPTMFGDLNRVPRLCEIAILHGRRTVRADRRLRTDEKHIRTQSAILDKTLKPCLVLTITAFSVRPLHPYEKRGWRAQRASPLGAGDGIYDGIDITGSSRWR
jgi:hypothetical protein